MIAKVSDYIQKYRMIEKNDTIVAGISGGADSVCLLFVLLEIREKIPFHLAVVHVNHGIRKEAGEDAAYVKKLCREKEVPFYLTETDVKAYAGRHMLSEEEAGREIRYRAFEEALEKELSFQDGMTEGNPQGKIAVAHNSNDRAETMLFHLFRGTGLTGLTGIRPVNGRIIRPLLCLERKEIEAWLQERNIGYQTDRTNEQDIYTRNKIRHHILPFAEENICSGAVSHMNQAAEHLMEAEEFVKRQTCSAKDRCVSCHQDHKEQSAVIDISCFLKEDSYLQGRILLSCLEDVAGKRKNITSRHINNIRKLFLGEGNGEVHLPYGVTVYKRYDVGMIVKGSKWEKGGLKEEEKNIFYEIPIPGKLQIPGLGKVEFTVFPYKKSENIPRKTYTKWFDYDKITKSIVFRVREKGDYLIINDGMNRKSLKDYFINEKIPKEKRDSLYILADGSHILWVPGYRISEYYKISEDTLNVLQVRIEKEDSYKGKES